jgi:rhodanese-related sulfurtransferase
VDELAVLDWALNSFGWFFIGYSVLINSSFLLLTLLAIADFWAYLRRVDFAAYDETFAEPLTPGVSILMPAHNESAGIVESVEAMTALRYPDFEVVVVDDGSSDDTAARLIEAFDMVEVPIVVPQSISARGQVTATYLSRRGSNNVLLVQKANGGKADVLNVGIWMLLATSLLYAVVLTLAALAIEELSFRRYRGVRDIAIAVWAAVEENLGFRQLNAWWRMGGSLEAWRGTKHDWGDMQRRGLGRTGGKP